MSYSINHEPIQQRERKPPFPSHIKGSDNNSSVSNLSTPTLLPIRIPNKVDEFFKKYQSQSTQQDSKSLSSFDQNSSSKDTQHQINHIQSHKSKDNRRNRFPTLSNQCTHDNREQSKPHFQLILLRRTNQINYNEEASSNTTPLNIKQNKKQKQKEENKSWLDNSTNEKFILKKVSTKQRNKLTN